MNEHQKMVLEFHRAFGHHVRETPSMPAFKIKILRDRLIQEEAEEFNEAIHKYDIVKTADAIADLLYVTYGAALAFGIDIEPIFAEVHRTNMLKLGGKKDEHGKSLKPKGWEPPRIKEILEKQEPIK